MATACLDFLSRIRDICSEASSGSFWKSPKRVPVEVATPAPLLDFNADENACPYLSNKAAFAGKEVNIDDCPHMSKFSQTPKTENEMCLIFYEKFGLTPDANGIDEKISYDAAGAQNVNSNSTREGSSATSSSKDSSNIVIENALTQPLKIRPRSGTHQPCHYTESEETQFLRNYVRTIDLFDIDTGITLGIGSFSRIRIAATHKNRRADEDHIAFAMKILRKTDIIEMDQSV